MPAENIERNIEIYREMKTKKKSALEIAEENGMTKQRAYMIVRDMDATIDGAKTGSRKTLNRIIYPKIRAWLQQRDMPVSRFAKMCGRSPYAALNAFLKGETKGDIYLIMDILNVTGMTFEQAFCKEVK